MTSYFSGFVDFVGAHPHYALTAVFLLALSEAISVDKCLATTNELNAAVHHSKNCALMSQLGQSRH
jgi:hypothetical protein